MLDIAEENELVRIKARGTHGGSDYDRFVPIFERIAAKESASVPMLIELASNFSGWDLSGLWRDLKFDAGTVCKYVSGSWLAPLLVKSLSLLEVSGVFNQNTAIAS